ncbi:methylamine utilization protein [Undibacterium curvum]|uniref:Methylamine utilization protein n=1 Tax=Undibacterium curvum TaxID=2762294 RepID=A0ABR7A184_9BURK|nr:methylamine utilization protein [Undibacterium curvum]MBC3930678.1 methylamine utilization protein [Undibacterium curvum]
MLLPRLCFAPCFPAILTGLLLMAGMQTAHANRLVQILDSEGKAVENAVVSAEAVNGNPPVKAGSYTIEQKDRKFLPLVSVIPVGSAVSFPNNDTVKHHAYSFSAAKRFELKLYSGKPSNPVVFDTAGTVVIGCNIHDQMIAYVQVVNTPYFAKTDAKGLATLANMPSGKYTLKVWHYKMAPGSEGIQQSWQTDAEGTPHQVRLNGKFD